jgi:phage-related minor tail protein
LTIISLNVEGLSAAEKNLLPNSAESISVILSAFKKLTADPNIPALEWKA